MQTKQKNNFHMTFLKDIKGVIHVGANKGNERHIYNQNNLNVLWFEPIPSVFSILQRKISYYKEKQKCIQALITDEDDKEYEFKVSSNSGLSSSIFDLNLHKQIWKRVSVTNSIKIKSTTLNSVFKNNSILDINLYDSMIIDTQGSELLVLNGASNIVPKMKYIMVEIADFEAYTGCCKLPEMEEFMKNNGFRECERIVQTLKESNGVGNYFDMVYKRLN